jgi:hypothetical protein
MGLATPTGRIVGQFNVPLLRLNARRVGIPGTTRLRNGPDRTRRRVMSWIVLLLILILLIGALPAYPYSRGWGYGPSGVLGLLLVVVLLLALTGGLR